MKQSCSVSKMKTFFVYISVFMMYSSVLLVVVYDQWHVIVLYTFGFGLWVNIWVS